MKDNQLFNSSLIFFVVICGALIFTTIVHKRSNYKINNNTLLKELTESSYTINYLTLHELISEGNEKYSFIDLRSALDYNEGHIKNASNIPFESITDKAQLKALNKAKTTQILYSENEQTTLLAFLILKSLGVKNLRTLPGNYAVINGSILSKEKPLRSYYFYTDEKARWDYKRFANTSIINDNKEVTKGVIPQQIEIKQAVKGGC